MSAVHHQDRCCFCIWRSCRAASGIDLINLSRNCRERLVSRRDVVKTDTRPQPGERGQSSSAETVLYLDGVEEWGGDESLYIISPAAWRVIRPFVLFFLEDCNVKIGTAILRVLGFSCHQERCVWYLFGDSSQEFLVPREKGKSNVWLQLPTASDTIFQRFVHELFGFSSDQSKCITICGNGFPIFEEMMKMESHMRGVFFIESISEWTCHVGRNSCSDREDLPGCQGVAYVPLKSAGSKGNAVQSKGAKFGTSLGVVPYISEDGPFVKQEVDAVLNFFQPYEGQELQDEIVLDSHFMQAKEELTEDVPLLVMPGSERHIEVYDSQLNGGKSVMEEKVESTKVLCTCIRKTADENIDDILQLCSDYNLLFMCKEKTVPSPFRKFHFGGRSAMVECPVCSKPYKAKASGMLGLCQHIKRCHAESSKVLFSDLQDVYKDMFHYMKTKIRGHAATLYKRRLRCGQSQAH